jgi:hypothetical protein
MNNSNFDTLSSATNALTQEGYKESFKAEDTCIRALYSKKAYQPEDLTIEKHFRFEGMTNPADQTELMAITAKDGLKGTLVMSYGPDSNQNTDLIKKIKSLN